LYVAVELSAKDWLLTMSTGSDRPRLRAHVRPGDRRQLEQALGRAKTRWGLPAEAPVCSCVEAGRDGFWPHRFLTAVGVRNRVVDSSSIEVPRRARRAKTDRLDGEKLLRLLLREAAGERDVWQVVRVPDPAQEDARHASRALTTIQKDRTRYRNRVHSLLGLEGVRLRLDARFPERVAAARNWAGEALGPGLQARVVQTWRLLTGIETERQGLRKAERQRTIAGATPTAKIAQQLTHLRGVAARSATILAEELFSRPLRNRREVGALAGLVSMPYQSGAIHRDQGLTRSGLPAVRRIAVEIGWAWTRYQPLSALTRWYQARFARGGAGLRRVGIVALARRVIIALWRYVTRGVIPDGALLKA
jgi:transposase